MQIIFWANPPDYQERIKSGTHGPPAPVPAQMPLAEATAGPWVGRQAALLYGVLVRHYLGLSQKLNSLAKESVERALHLRIKLTCGLHTTTTACAALLNGENERREASACEHKQCTGRPCQRPSSSGPAKGRLAER